MLGAKKLSTAYVGTSVFSAKIFCGDCGTCFGPKVWHSTSKYRRVVWQCNDKFKGDHKCTTPHLTEETIQNKFLEAYNQLLHDREPIITDLRTVQQSLCDMTDLDKQLENISEELEVTEVMIRSVIEDNATKVQNQAKYLGRYEKYMAKLDSLKARYAKVEKERTDRQQKYHVMEKFIQTLADAKSLPIEFDPDTFMAVTDKITVFSDGHMEFTFIGGITVSVMI